MKKIRMGVVGVGGMAQAHIAGINDSPDAELTAVCDIVPKTLAAVGDRNGVPESHRFASYKDLIACPDVDAVSICTPNYLHFAMGMDAVKAGKPFLIEKPVTMAAAEAVELEAAAKAAGIPNMVDFSYRFKAAARYAKMLVASGALGQIRQVYGQYLQSWSNNPQNTRAWRYVKAEAGTGVLGDLGSHLMDMASFITGRKILSLVSHTDTLVHERPLPDGTGAGAVDVDDYCDILAKMEGGVAASLSVTRFAFARGNYQRMEVYGSRGGLVYKLDEDGKGGDVLEVCIGGDPANIRRYLPADIPKECYVEQFQSFFDIVLHKEDGLAGVMADGAVNQALLDAAEKSAATGQWVSVE